MAAAPEAGRSRNPLALVCLLAPCLLALCLSACSRQSAPSYSARIADLILLHGHIYTADPAHPWAEALALHQDRILAVGSNQAIVKYKLSATRVVDLHGHIALPGLIDSHTHFLEGSRQLANGTRQRTASPDEQLRWLQLGLQFANQHGITTVINSTAGDAEEHLFEQLHQSQSLTVRIVNAFPAGAGIALASLPDKLRAFANRRHRDQSVWLRAGAVEFSPESASRSARMPRGSVSRQISSLLEDDLSWLEHGGYQVAVQSSKALAPSAIEQAFAHIEQQNGRRDRRWQVQYEPTAGASFWHSLVEPSGPTILASDWPAGPLDPFAILQAAVTRQVAGGATLDQALAAFTRHAAYGAFLDQELGTLAPGKLADLIVVSPDPFHAPAGQLKNTKVLMTLVGGKRVWGSVD